MRLIQEYHRQVASITEKYQATKTSISASDYRAYCLELKPYWDELIARIKDAKHRE